MLDRIFRWRKAKYVSLYDSYVDEGRHDIALSIAVKHGLGNDLERKAAQRWYEILVGNREFTKAESVAMRFRLPEEYVKHAQMEKLRLMAKQMEDGSYVLLESARELRNQADRIESSVRIGEGRVSRFLIDKNDVSWGGMQGSDPVSSEKLSSALKLHESGSRLLNDIGLLIYESELRLGNETYAALVADGYGINEEDRQKIVEIVSNSRNNNNR